MPSGYIQTRRARLATLEHEGKGPTIVMLHGTFSNSRWLVPVADQLSGRRIILVDLPGFGRSPVSHSSSLIDDTVLAVIELIQELKEPVILMGHSFGGLIAARVMNKLHTEIRKLILLQPILQPLSAKYRYSGITGSILKRMKSSRFKQELLAGGDFSDGGDLMEEYVTSLIYEMKSPRIRHTNSWAMSQLTRPSSFQQLHPEAWSRDQVQILIGERDQRFRLPDRYLRFVSGTLPFGHQFPIEAPHLTAQWLDSLLPPSDIIGACAIRD